MPAAARDSGYDVVGRDAELRHLRDLVQLPTDQPRIVLIDGEPGIGKTTVWRTTLGSVPEGEHNALTAGGSVAETRLSFAALRDLLDQAFDHAAEALPPPQRHALAVALLREEPTGQPLEHGAVAVAFLGLLRALAQESPTLVAVDDIQWLDAASATALGYAIRRLRNERVIFLLARRAEGHEPLPLDLDRIDPGRLEVLRLGPLTIGAVGQLLYERLNTMYPRPTLRRIHEVSGGNPLYALELGRALEGSEGRPGAERMLPRSLRDLARERLRLLPPRTLDVLMAAASLAKPTLDLLETVSGRNPYRALLAAVDAHVVEIDDDRVRFTHPLLAAAVRQLSAPRRRRELHRRLADIVDDPEERGLHLSLATTEPDEKIAKAVEAGSEAAFRRGAVSAAAELAAEARRLTPSDRPEDESRRALAEAEYRFEAGDAAGASTLVERLIAACPPGPARARLLSRRARYVHFEDDVGAGVAVQEQALAEAGDDPELRAGIEEGLAWGLLLMRKDLPAAAAHARSATRLAEEVGDQAALCEALAAQALTEFVRGIDSWPVMERALALEEHTLHLRVLRHPTFAYGYMLSCADEHERAREVFHGLRRRATDRGDDSALPPILNHLALIECLAGNWDLAADHCDEAYALALQGGQRPSQASILSKRALLRARQGPVEEARAVANQALAIAGGAGFDEADPERALARGGEVAIWALGFLALSLGRLEEARDHLAPLCRTLLGAGIRDPGELRPLPDLIESLVGLDQLDEAERLLGPYEATTRRLDRPSAHGEAGRCRGLLLAESGDASAAADVLETAVHFHQRSGMPFEHARTLLALGEVRRRARQKRTSREALEAAVAGFEHLGSTLWAERAREGLGRIGGRAPSVGGLTTTEARVAALVARGLPTKEVARELFVSAKTVEGHLSHIYAKLGVRSRAELASRLAKGSPGPTESAH